MSDHFAFDVFVDYSSKDQDQVQYIVDQLEELGLWVWFKQRNIRPGDDVVARVNEGFLNSRSLLLCMTPSALNSSWGELERNTMIFLDPSNESRRLIPLLLTDCEIPPIIARLSYIDGREITGEVIQEIAQACLPNQTPNKIQKTGRTTPDNSLPLPYLFNVPLERNPAFCGREELLSQTEEELRSDHSLAITQAFHGLGGVGKTQIALEFIYRHQSKYRLIWWLRAEFAFKTLLDDYKELARELGIGNAKMNNSDVRNEVRRWLETNRRWLLVFDNVESPDLIRNLLPRTKTGDVLITSRNPNWENLANAICIDVFQRKQSVEFLTHQTMHQGEEGPINALAELLGDFPLALDQAASYIRATQMSVEEYCELFMEHEADLMTRGTPSQGYEKTVATTWNISFDCVRNSDGATTLLELLAYCQTDKVEKDLFFRQIDLLPSSLNSRLLLNDSIALLRSYSLIEARGVNLYMHRLVRTIIRNQCSQDSTSKIVVDALYTGMRKPAIPVEEPAIPVEEPAIPVEEPAIPVEEPAIPVEEPVSHIDKKNRIVIKNLECFYDKLHAVRDINVNVPLHAVTALIGTSGSGRSTILKVIAGLHKFDQNLKVDGSIQYLNGRPNGIVLISDALPLPSRSIYDSVSFGIQLKEKKNRSELDRLVERSLISVSAWKSMKGRLKTNVHSLSLREQRQVKIAMAIASQPDLLLLDTGVSEIGSHAFSKVINDIKVNCTIVIATNNLEMAATVSDYTALILNGSLIEFGDTITIFARPAKAETENFVTGRR